MEWNKINKVRLFLTALMSLFCMMVISTSSMATPNMQSGNNQQITYLQDKNKFLQKTIRIEVRQQTRLQVLQEIGKKADIKLSYNANLEGLNDIISLELNNSNVEDALWKALAGTNIRFAISENGQLALFPDSNFRKKEKVKRQTGTVTGQVIDGRNGEPLPGANVSVQGTTNGASTNANGGFTLEDVGIGNQTIVATFVGYQKSEKEVSVREDEVSTINFELQFDSQEFEEVVVVGYGSVDEKDLTGSVSQVSSEELAELSPTINVDQALQGQAAGVSITQESGQPGSAARVRIRGSSSLLGSNQPLYVIDGVPVESESNIPNDGSTFNTGLLQQGLNSPLGNINPNDIESISVLKDASAAAIYGSRAANGVIIINTKQGANRETAIFETSYSVSTQEARTAEVLNAEEFRMIYEEAVANSNSTDLFSQSVRDGSYFGDANTNWEEEVSRGNPVTNNFNISARGGNENVQYYTSLGVQDQAGVFEQAAFKRYSGTLNLDAQLTSKIDLGSRLNLSASDQSSPDDALLDRVYDFRPDVPVYNEDGGYSTSGNYALENPVALAQASNQNTTTQFIGSVFGTYEFLEELVFKTELKVNYNSGKQKSAYPSFTFQGGWSSFSGAGDGFAKQGENTSYTHIWDNTLTYSGLIGNSHNITALLGASFEGYRRDFMTASGEGFPKDNVLTNLSSASSNFQIASDEIQSGLVSYFSRLNYDYGSKYILTLSGRVDRSSKFAEDNQWGFFPAVAGAWRVSNEPFFSDISFIDDLKFRASAGITGEQSFGPYQWRTLFSANQYGGDAAVLKTQLGNSELKWEVTKQLDFGLDFMMFNDRLSGSLGYYVKNTEDLHYFFKTPGNTGFNQAISNLGETQNKGIEVALSGDIIRSNDFNWKLSGNLTHNTNKLVSLNDDFRDADRGVINPPNTGSVLEVGEPLGLMYGYVSEGIFQSQDVIDELNSNAPSGTYQYAETAPGDLRFKDIDGDGQITDADQSIIGNAQPDFTGGITNTFNYKGFTLSALFTYSVGNDLRWGYQGSAVNFGSTYMSENKSAMVLDRWTEDNPTNQPRAVYGDPNNNDRISSYYVHDASYIRLKNIRVQYTLSERLKPNFLRSASVYAVAQNMLTFTDYPGADPETSNLFNDDVSSGLDNNRYPTPKVFTIGVNVGF